MYWGSKFKLGNIGLSWLDVLRLLGFELFLAVIGVEVCIGVGGVLGFLDFGK